ncbi:hypothetical protein D4R78_02650 [bacterium]|nr:MAG: hypothetical protein D4R78_02650 [bacterium]
MNKSQGYSGSEQRRYLRLDSVFPVQFRLLSLDGRRFLSDWLQGFTNDISKGGICLTINSLNPELTQILKNQQARFLLDIEMPITKTPIPAEARIAWFREATLGKNRCLVGLTYEKISPAQNNMIMRYVVTKKIFVPAVYTLIILLVLGLAVNSVINLKLIRGNKKLVSQLVKFTQETNLAREKIREITKDRENLQAGIQDLQSSIRRAEGERGKLEEKIKLETMARLEVKARLDEKTGQENTAITQKISEYNAIIQKLSQEKSSLQSQLAILHNQQTTATQELLRLDIKKNILEKANFDKMYLWLKVHQNPRTGLVMSFEGDGEIANWAFIYDQALVIQAYTLFADYERARKILDFFDRKAKTIDGRFLNAYYANDGDPAEFVVHSGPNIWLGIAIMQYTQKSKDTRYLKLAEGIAQSVIHLQNQDTEGGIRGGPNVSWYATEHNLDAYAFFNMLYQVTAKQQYRQSRDKVLNWLIQNSYARADIPIKRGKGDSTIATDTYAWSIAAIGPEKLKELGMDPDKIIEFAEENCSVEVIYQRPDGQNVKIKGFDFAAKKHIARGGVVSPEWTAQMVLAFKIMSDAYYKKQITEKTRIYSNKANDYLRELSKMVISSPSPTGQGEGCLPYATQDSVDTGHGWITPKGKSTGSVAGTTYTLFAYYGYNPLQLKE